MNKLFTKIAGGVVGIAMAIGVGVAVGGHKSVARVKAEQTLAKTYDLSDAVPEDLTSSVTLTKDSTRGMGKAGTTYTLTSSASYTNVSKIVVSAATNWSSYSSHSISITVGGNAFASSQNFSAKALTDYTFEVSSYLSGAIVVSLNNSAEGTTKSNTIWVKTIKVYVEESIDPDLGTMTIMESDNPLDGGTLQWSNTAGIYHLSAEDSGAAVSGVTWSTSNSEIATIGASTGYLTTVAPGQVIIYAEAEGYNKASAAVTITPGWKVESVTVSGSMTKTSYFTSESWSNAGLTATAEWNTGYLEDVTSTAVWTYSPAAPAEGVKSVVATATYEEESGSSSAQAVTVTVAHAGTAEDPFTVAEGIAKCKEIGTTAAGPWVVRGIISKKTAWDSQYPNVTYWISDDGTGEDSKTTTIQCFRGKYLEGADVTSSNEGEFAVGKIVKVTGNLVNYYGNTPEYAAGNYPLSIESPSSDYTITYNANGGTGTMASTTGTVAECTFTAPEGKKFSKWNTAANGSGTDYAPGAIANSDLNLFAIWEDNPYSHAGTSEDPFTVAEGILKCKENGTTAGGPWVVSGIISKVQTWDSGYPNITYWISDDGTGEDSKTTTIECFRGKYLNGANVTSDNYQEFAKGKIVKVTGNLVNYGNNTPEYAQNNSLLSIEEPAATKYSVVSRIDNGSLSISEIYENTQLSVSVVPELGYYYPSSLTFVRVAGVDVPYTYENGVVTVAASYITGNVVIEGTCVECNPIKSLYAFPAGTASGTVYGYYVGSTSDGLVIMDGEYGILIYHGSSEGLVEGETIVEVSGIVDSYNGLGQIKNATINVASGEYPAPATPVTYAAAGGETREYASRLTTVSGVPTVTSGSFDDVAGTNDIKMNFAVSGATVEVFYKKAAQTADAEAFAAVKEAVTNSTSVTVKGFTAWYNGFQVQMNGYVAPAEGYTAEDFAQDLLDQTDAVCEGWTEGVDNHDALVVIWTNLASNDKYPSLPDDQKEILAEAARDEGGTVVERAMARYDFLTGKYNLSNFINGRTPIVSQRGYLELNAESNNNTMIIIVVIASVSAISLATLLILKKKKHN